MDCQRWPCACPNLLSNGFECMNLCEANGGVVKFNAIDATLVGDPGHSSYVSPTILILTNSVCIVVVGCVSLEVEVGVSCFGDELKVFFHSPNYLLTIIPVFTLTFITSRRRVDVTMDQKNHVIGGLG